MSQSTTQPALASSPGSNVDGFIAARLPPWMKRASLAQLETLRSSFNGHKVDMEKLQVHTRQLQPMQAFAEGKLKTLLPSGLPKGLTFEQLEWLVVFPSVDTLGESLQVYRYASSRRNGLLQLMANFAANSSYWKGTGLVAPGMDKVISGNTDTLVRACRQLDVGRQYQQELDRVFDSATVQVLANHKRSGLKLASEVAALKGDIDAQVQKALREAVDGSKDLSEHGLRAYPGLLQVLGRKVVDGLYISLKDEKAELKSVVLYLPSDPHQALRVYPDHEEMQAGLAALLRGKDYQQYFTQLISLEHRADFVHVLRMRLDDDLPDLEVEGRVPEEVFAEMADEQVQRVKGDARLLLVPTDDVDTRVARERQQAWKAAGLEIINLAGLFIPVVGALLLGRLVLQVLGETFEGAVDWSEGHQHEALDHLINVAKVVAVAGATAGVVSAARSAFVDGLEPVSLGDSRARLWSNDLDAYQSSPEAFSLREDGLYEDGERRWMRIDKRYYEIHRPEPTGPYRLRHPLRDQAYGPVVLHNGERGWQLMLEQPQTWDDPAQMLDRLWPQHPPLDTYRAEQVLQVAGTDLDELRGVLVEGRVAPVNLSMTLNLFETDTRIARFFRHVQSHTLADGDLELLAWCEQQPGIGKGLANVLRNKVSLRGPLLKHLTTPGVVTDPLQALLARDLPGLPEPYSRMLAEEADMQVRASALEQGKVPLTLATQARSLLRLARLNRALAGLYLPSAYSDETGELVLALLDQFNLDTLSLELRSAVGGKVFKTVGAGWSDPENRVLVHDRGEFHLYDSTGSEIDLGLSDPGDVFQALHAILSPAQREELGLAVEDTGAQLRERLLEQLPASHDGVASLLHWQAEERWFNPGHRLEDGRVGYLLSDHPALPRAAPEQLRDQLARFFPGLQGRLDDEMERLLVGRTNAYEVLAELQDDHEQVERALNSWLGASPNATGRAARERFVTHLRMAWRCQAQDTYDDRGNWRGQKLFISAPTVASLPSFPLQVTFNHLTALSIRNTSITHFAHGFLSAFTALRELNLSDNRLTEFPANIGFLTNLRSLKLANNQIRLHARAERVLYGLGQLQELDFSRNPLEHFNLRFAHLSQLTTLRLRDTGLKAWPEHLELCGFLEDGDLRGNNMGPVPDEVLRMPIEFRRTLRVDFLSAIDSKRLVALDPIPEEQEEVDALDIPTVRRWWVEEDAASAVERGNRWDTLLAAPEGSDLRRVFGNLVLESGFAWPKSELIDNGWNLLLDINADEQLRGRVYRLAEQKPAPGNATSECFSQMLVDQAVTAAVRDVQEDQGDALLSLGRSLFRMEQLHRIGRRDAAQRGARVDDGVDLAVRLAYRTGLRGRLGLIGQPHFFRAVAGAEVSAEQLASAQQQVATLEASNAFLIDLNRRPFWEQLLRLIYPRYFESRPLYFLELREEVIQQRTAALQAESRGAYRQALEKHYEQKLKQIQAAEELDDSGPRRLPLHLSLRLFGRLRDRQG